MAADDAHRHEKLLSPQPTAEAAEMMQDVAQAGMAVIRGAQGWDWVQVEVGGEGGVVVGVGSGSITVEEEEEEDAMAEEVVEEDEGGGHSFSRQVHPWLAGLLKAA